MAKNFFEIHGAREIGLELAELARSANNVIVRPGLRKGAAHIRKIAKKIAPRDDGFLRKAIQSKVFTNKGGAKGVVAKIGILKNSFTDEDGRPVIAYAGVQNEETKFLARALAQGKAEAIKILIASTQEQLNKFHAKNAAKAAAAAAKGRR